MKKFLALLLVLAMIGSLAACTNSGNANNNGTTTAPSDPKPSAPTPSDPADNKGEGVMTYEQYMAAEMESEVTVEVYVQATQSWWEKDGQGVITVYAQDHDGGYFLYEMPCSEEDAAKLVPGTKLRVTGTKTEWSGQIEIVDITKMEILEGKFIAEPQDLTKLLNNEEELIKKMNVLGAFRAMTVESIDYADGEPGKDIYVTLMKYGKVFEFCVESYLTGPDSELYQFVAQLQKGDIVDVGGFVYWYYGINTHITGIAKTEDPKGEGVMTYDQYVEAELETEVTIEAYVQATQGWYEDEGKGVITVYTQDLDGAYFLYKMPCSQEDAAKLVPGTKIRVTGIKAAWSGEVEIVDISSMEILEGEYIAEAKNITEIMLDEAELIKLQNRYVSVYGATLTKVEYKGEGDDIYVTVTVEDQEFNFCVESYLTGEDTDVYKAFGELEIGTVINLKGFMYWYEGPNMHITSVELRGR